MGRIQIESPGPLTTVQDLGRIGYMDSGFPQSGAVDWYAASLANILCKNEENSAVLEITLGGFSCRQCFANRDGRRGLPHLSGSVRRV